MMGWVAVLGRLARAGARAGKERKKGRRWVGPGLRGLAVQEGNREGILDLNLNSPFKFKSHTIESNKVRKSNSN
jgi:hypothetical protein